MVAFILLNAWALGISLAVAVGLRRGEPVAGALFSQARVGAEERRRILKTTRRLIERAGRRCSS